MRLIGDPGSPGTEHRPDWRARLAWGVSTSVILDLLGALPGVLNIVFETRDAILFGLVWVFKLVRYAPGLIGLRRAIGTRFERIFNLTYQPWHMIQRNGTLPRGLYEFDATYSPR